MQAIIIFAKTFSGIYKCTMENSHLLRLCKSCVTFFLHKKNSRNFHMKEAWNSQHDHKAHLWPNLWKIFRSARWQNESAFRLCTWYLLKQASKHRTTTTTKVIAFSSIWVNAYETTKVIAFSSIWVNAYETTKVIAFSSIWVNVYETTKVIAFSSIWVNVITQPRWLHFHLFG